MVGSSGGETGVRGFVAAFDADTGKEAWRTYTVPGPGEPGGDSWPEGDADKTCAAARSGSPATTSIKPPMVLGLAAGSRRYV